MSVLKPSFFASAVTGAAMLVTPSLAFADECETDPLLPHKITMTESFKNSKAKLLDNKVIVIEGEITNSTPYEVYSDLKALAKFVKSGEEIEVLVNSSGGSLIAGLATASFLENSAFKVKTIVTGYAMSSGFVIAMAGKKREIYASAMAMHHFPYEVDCTKEPSENTAFDKRNDVSNDDSLYHLSDLEDQLENLKKNPLIEQYFNQFFISLSTKTGHPKEALELLFSEDCFLNPNLAKEMGFFTKVIGTSYGSKTQPLGCPSFDMVAKKLNFKKITEPSSQAGVSLTPP